MKGTAIVRYNLSHFCVHFNIPAMDGAGVQMVKIRGKFHVEQKLRNTPFQNFCNPVVAAIQT